MDSPRNRFEKSRRRFPCHRANVDQGVFCVLVHDCSCSWSCVLLGAQFHIQFVWSGRLRLHGDSRGGHDWDIWTLLIIYSDWSTTDSFLSIWRMFSPTPPCQRRRWSSQCDPRRHQPIHLQERAEGHAEWSKQVGLRLLGEMEHKVQQEPRGLPHLLANLKYFNQETVFWKCDSVCSGMVGHMWRHMWHICNRSFMTSLRQILLSSFLLKLVTDWMKCVGALTFIYVRHNPWLIVHNDRNIEWMGLWPINSAHCQGNVETELGLTDYNPSQCSVPPSLSTTPRHAGVLAYILLLHVQDMMI